MMAMVMSNLYDALRSAGATDDTARKAAEEVATYEHRFATVDSRLNLLTWMVAFNLAISAAILAKLLV